MEKERKLYHVSALCLAKSLSELPLSLIQPFVYLTVIYWVANLSSFSAFLWSLVVLALDVYAAQVSDLNIHFVYLTVIYWVANLSSFSAYLWSLVVIALYVYAAQDGDLNSDILSCQH